MNVGLHIIHRKECNKLIVISNKYIIHLKALIRQKKGKWPLSCKIKDRKTNSTVKSKIFLFDEKIDLEKLKEQMLYCSLPNEIKFLEPYLDMPEF